VDRNPAGGILIVIGKLLAIAFLSSIGAGVVYQVVTSGYAALAGGEKLPAMVGALAALIALVALFAWLSWLWFRGARAPQPKSMSSGLECPPLVAVKRPYAGETIEQALDRFEEDCSEENYQGVKVLDQRESEGGILARYDVYWKYSVFDDGAYCSHVGWALLAPANPAAGDPPGARYRVAAASAERHMPDKLG
jgi:hypothetical protein